MFLTHDIVVVGDILLDGDTDKAGDCGDGCDMLVVRQVVAIWLFVIVVLGETMHVKEDELVISLGHLVVA